MDAITAPGEIHVHRLTEPTPLLDMRLNGDRTGNLRLFVFLGMPSDSMNEESPDSQTRGRAVGTDGERLASLRFRFRSLRAGGIVRMTVDGAGAQGSDGLEGQSLQHYLVHIRRVS